MILEVINIGRTRNSEKQNEIGIICDIQGFQSTSYTSSILNFNHCFILAFFFSWILQNRKIFYGNFFNSDYLNIPWGHVICLKNFVLDRFSRLKFIGHKQTDRQIYKVDVEIWRDIRKDVCMSHNLKKTLSKVAANSNFVLNCVLTVRLHCIFIRYLVSSR